MEKIQKGILFIDWLPSAVDKKEMILDINPSQSYIIDPIQLCDHGDWSDFENNTNIINSIYGELFEQIVIKKKSLICYWPELEFTTSDWFEINQFISKSGLSLSMYENPNRDDKGVVSEKADRAWKVLVKFLIESVTEDIAINNSMVEIASFVNEEDTVHLFKINSEGIEKFTYGTLKGGIVQNREEMNLINHAHNNDSSFTSFDDMVLQLIEKIDVTEYDYTFKDRAFEKFFFTSILKKCTPKNLIKSWESGYVLN